MSKPTTSFNSKTALPKSLTQEKAVATLHNHSELITLNPLVTHHEPCPPPEGIPEEEKQLTWYSVKNRIDHLPFGLFPGSVTYNAGFADLENGIRTVVYAPMGLVIREVWKISVDNGEEGEDGTKPWLVEDGQMECWLGMGWFVRRTLGEAHRVLGERLGEKSP